MSDDLTPSKLVATELRALREQMHALGGEFRDGFRALRDEVREDLRESRAHTTQLEQVARQSMQGLDQRLRTVELAMARHAATERRDRKMSAGVGAGAGGALVMLVELAKYLAAHL